MKPLVTDWSRGSRLWRCRKCKQKTATPPAVRSRTPVPCRCGARDWEVVPIVGRVPA